MVDKYCTAMTTMWLQGLSLLLALLIVGFITSVTRCALALILLNTTAFDSCSLLFVCFIFFSQRLHLKFHLRSQQIIMSILGYLNLASTSRLLEMLSFVHLKAWASLLAHRHMHCCLSLSTRRTQQLELVQSWVWDWHMLAHKERRSDLISILLVGCKGIFWDLY